MEEKISRKKASALPDAEKPRKIIEKHLINLVLWVNCWPYQE